MSALWKTVSVCTNRVLSLGIGIRHGNSKGTVDERGRVDEKGMLEERDSKWDRQACWEENGGYYM